jgi:hypothetical protein
MHVRPVRFGRLLAFTSSLLVALLVGAQPAAAFTVLSSTGLTGPYSLTDASSPTGHQSATCTYATATYKLTKIEVRHPQVKARNRTGHLDRQSTGWQFIVQHQTPSGTTWSTIYSSTFAKATAADNLAAPFVNRTWAAPANPTGKYRIQLVIRWYTPGSSTTIDGHVKLRDAYYESKWNGNALISSGFCLQDY